MADLPTRMYVTTDAVTFSLSQDGRLEVLLVRRANEPFKGAWCIPGGFVDDDEDLPDACARELREEAGVRPTAMIQVGAWGKPGRDPRGRNVTVAYVVVVRPDARSLAPGDDAADAAWHLVDALPPLAFDHDEILAAAASKLRLMVLSTHVVFALLHERFTLRRLAGALAGVLGRQVGLREAEVVATCAGLEPAGRTDPESAALYRCVSDFLAPLKDRT
jgi:8-oxo-dGTP diphosphatase